MTEAEKQHLTEEIHWKSSQTPLRVLPSSAQNKVESMMVEFGLKWEARKRQGKKDKQNVEETKRGLSDDFAKLKRAIGNYMPGLSARQQRNNIAALCRFGFRRQFTSV